MIEALTIMEVNIKYCLKMIKLSLLFTHRQEKQNRTIYQYNNNSTNKKTTLQLLLVTLFTELIFFCHIHTGKQIDRIIRKENKMK